MLNDGSWIPDSISTIELIAEILDPVISSNYSSYSCNHRTPHPGFSSKCSSYTFEFISSNWGHFRPSYVFNSWNQTISKLALIKLDNLEILIPSCLLYDAGPMPGPVCASSQTCPYCWPSSYLIVLSQGSGRSCRCMRGSLKEEVLRNMFHGDGCKQEQLCRGTRGRIWSSQFLSLVFESWIKILEL